MLVKITDYSFGRVKVGNELYTNDIILYRGEVTSWWREDGHVVKLKDIEQIMANKPSYIVIGTGYYGAMKVSDEVVRKSDELGINLIIRKSEEACNSYNNLIDQGYEDVVLAIHLTC